MKKYFYSFIKFSGLIFLGILLSSNIYGQASLNAEELDSIEILEDSISQVLTFDDILNQDGSIANFKKQEPFAGGWFFVLNIVLLLLLLAKYILFNDYTRKSWNAWVNKNLFFQLVREKAPINLLVLTIETLIKLYVLAVLFYLARYLWLGYWEFTFSQFSKLFLVLAIFFITKYFITFLLTIVADQVEEYKSFGLNNIIFVSNLSWFVIPILLIVIYSNLSIRNYLIYILFAVVLLALFAYLYKCLTVALKMHIRFNVHFFIYLCAFEILPYLFLGKTLQNLNFIY